MIQETTMQVPCGRYSIFDPEMLVPEFCRAVFIVVNEHSNWATGRSHALSYSKLASLLNVKYRSQVIRAVQYLVDTGWLTVVGTRKSDGANIYQIMHHKCEPDQVPLDKDNRPQKCAVPRGEGSPTQLLSDGKIGWREMVVWVVKKVHSNWVTGIVEMTARQAGKFMRFAWGTISKCRKTMCEIGLLEKLSAKFRASKHALIPSPYPDRHPRLEDDGQQGLPLIKGWYYSFNFKWRFHRETFRLQCRELGRKWRDASDTELMRVNPKIHADFLDYQTKIIEIRGSLQEALNI